MPKRAHMCPSIHRRAFVTGKIIFGTLTLADTWLLTKYIMVERWHVNSTWLLHSVRRNAALVWRAVRRHGCLGWQPGIADELDTLALRGETVQHKKANGRDPMKITLTDVVWPRWSYTFCRSEGKMKIKCSPITNNRPCRLQVERFPAKEAHGIKMSVSHMSVHARPRDKPNATTRGKLRWSNDTFHYWLQFCLGLKAMLWPIELTDELYRANAVSSADESRRKWQVVRFVRKMTLSLSAVGVVVVILGVLLARFATDPDNFGTIFYRYLCINA